MRRVEADEQWSLIDPDEVPELPVLWGAEFDAAYRAADQAIAKGKADGVDTSSFEKRVAGWKSGT